MSTTIHNTASRARSRRPSIWTEIGNDAMIDISPSNYLTGHGLVGRAIGLMLLLICLPLIALLVLLVRITSRGPGLFRQVRVGKNGRIFVMYKLRSMIIDAEAQTGPVWTQNHLDPRITPVGAFLRKSHLDELPQLWNVATGEMALFGPRPERPELVHVLAEYVPGYLNRLAVKPGITGLAQINLPPDSDLESVRRKLKLDLEYIRTANLPMEIRMFLWTGLRLAAVPSAVATRLCGLGRRVPPTRASRSVGPVTIEEVLREHSFESAVPSIAD